VMPPRIVYMDECVRLSLAARLRLRGFTVFTARDEGLAGLSDRQQLVYATRQGWLIVLHNTRDFVRLHRQIPIHTGIITLPATNLDLQEIRTAMLLDWVATFPDHRSRLFRWHDLQQHLIGGGRLPGYGEEDVRRALGQISSSSQ
jgi:predicted nuclease of predicted toxin-antitoxin system